MSSGEFVAKRKSSASDTLSSKKQAKREMPINETPPSDVGQGKGLVHPKRILPLKAGTPGSGPVIYWMSRDQRMADNWAMIHAAEKAVQAGSPVAVAFNLVSEW